MNTRRLTEERPPIVVAVTGASGAVYAVRLLQELIKLDSANVHLTISPSGAAVVKQELGIALDLSAPALDPLLSYLPPWSRRTASERHAASVTYHRYDDYLTPIASGSFRTHAMIVCPCSGTTLSGIAHAGSANLIQRAAEVHLKERRKLILVPRETPLSVLQLENMHRLAAAGAVILPAMPGWYHGVDSLDAIVDFVVGRILDQLEIDNALMTRWGQDPPCDSAPCDSAPRD